ncbi:MAG: Rpn family recombination-promoting nuclease/putative transposase, partial [Candidatus Competibacteraceae bacterium]
MRYVDPLTDFGFKKIFSEPPGQPLLVSLLNDVLALPEPVARVRVRNLEQLPDAPAQRRMVYDLLCVDQLKRAILVEVQRAGQTYFKDRTLFYASHLVRRQGQAGTEWNYRLRPVYVIAILNAVLSKTVLRRVTLKDEANEVFYDKFGLVFIELPCFTKTVDQLDTHLDQWLYFLKHAGELEVMPTIFKGDVIERAFTMAELYAMSEEDRERYQDELKHYRDVMNMLDTAREQGI